MPDTAELRTKARRVKNHILTRYLSLADRVDAKGEGDLSESEQLKYWELTKDFAKNVIPRSQEITGEDGEVIKLSFDPVFKPNATPPETEGNSPEPVEVQDSPSGS
jgi:hypothetical protein